MRGWYFCPCIRLFRADLDDYGGFLSKSSLFLEANNRIRGGFGGGSRVLKEREYGSINIRMSVDKSGVSRTKSVFYSWICSQDRVSVYCNPDHSEARVQVIFREGFPMVIFTVLMAVLVTVSGFLLKQTMRGVKLVVPRIQWMKWSLSSAALVAANSVPVFGVLFFQWNLFHILLLYQVESGVIGWYAILRQFRGNFAEALGSSFLF
jgi:hypothetical protein